MNENKDAVNRPEQYGPYIAIAWDMYKSKESGVVWRFGEMSAGQEACMDGIQQGFNAAQNERTKQAKQKQALVDKEREYARLVRNAS